MLTKDEIDALMPKPYRSSGQQMSYDGYDKAHCHLFSLEQVRSVANDAIASHTRKVLEDVEPVAWWAEGHYFDTEAEGLKFLLSEANQLTDGLTSLYSAHTVAALKSERDALQARVDAVPEEFTQGIDAAAKMLDKMADDYSNAHAVQDPDTGVYEFGRGAKEDYYNTLRELADDVRSIVYSLEERAKQGASNARS